jgi:hypothetical protein
MINMLKSRMGHCGNFNMSQSSAYLKRIDSNNEFIRGYIIQKTMEKLDEEKVLSDENRENMKIEARKWVDIYFKGPASMKEAIEGLYEYLLKLVKK